MSLEADRPRLAELHRIAPLLTLRSRIAASHEPTPEGRRIDKVFHDRQPSALPLTWPGGTARHPHLPLLARGDQEGRHAPYEAPGGMRAHADDNARASGRGGRCECRLMPSSVSIPHRTAQRT